jgi:galactokinase
VDRTALALAGQRAETDIVGAPVGVMDQLASVYGETDAAVFLDCRSLAVEVVPVPLAEQDLELLVVDSRVTHAHATGGYASRRRACEEAASLLGVEALRDATLQQVDDAADRLGDERHRRARHVVTENARVIEAVRALRAGDLGALGPLLAAGHASLRKDFEVSCPELDLAVTTALDAGAVAARMTGGGFGGSVVAIVPAGRGQAVSEAEAAAAAAHGFPTPQTRTVQLSAGARRLR